MEIISNGVSEVITIQNSTEETEKDKTSSYTVDISKYTEGAKLQWRVRTSGVTNEFGDWSVLRTVDIYAPPTLSLSMVDENEDPIENLISYPIRVRAVAGPSSQRAIGYHLTITSNDIYDTIDNFGREKIINKGDTLYSRYFDRSGDFSATLSANDVRLENNMSYRIACVASMNSGLTAESYLDFTVMWDSDKYRIDCRIYIDSESYTASISPYCKDKTGALIKDVALSVFRREFDGKFTEINSNIENVKNMFVSDPHPSLDYARYRIIATSKTTGQVAYYDAPAYPVGGKAAIIQWDEQWTDFDTDIQDTLASPTWSGSMLKLPYNIDISDSNSKDVALVEYIGREHPVTYHGTQLGTSSTWNTDIPADDKETLYALRRLQNWMGDVYVREPSGAGYWANVSVTFSKKHRNLVIPVTIEVTRVEGGV